MSKAKASTSKEKYPSHLGTREIVFTNLLLLGFEPGAMESKYNIPFTKDMFALPNKKAFEVIMHFLFIRLNPVMAAEKFRVLWPISDKKQEQLFRRAVADWLQEISKEDPDSNLPRIVPSLFLSPGGDKFYTVLFYFTEYVVFKAIKGENGEKERQILTRPHLSHGMSALSSVILKSYQAATIQRQQQALEQAQTRLYMHGQWQECVSEFVKENRSLSKKTRDFEHKVRDLYAKSYDLAQARGEVMTSRRRSGLRSDGEKEVLAVKRSQKLQKVRELWKVVDNLVTKQVPEREVVESILQEVAMKSRLDADDIHVQVPEMLLRECEAEIHRRNIANVYPGGKLSLLSLIQLWNLALKLYLENVQQAPLARFDTIAPSVVTQVHTHHAHLSNAQTLRSNLTKEFDTLKGSIGTLRRYASVSKTPGRSSIRQFHSSTLGLSLLPATPPVSFEPASSNEATPARLHLVSALNHSNNRVDTPEAVSRMSQDVDKVAMRASGLVQGTPSSMLKDLRYQIHGISKLPVPTENNTRPRRRIVSAPSKIATPQHHSRPKRTPGQSQRKQITKSSKTSVKIDNGSQLRRHEGSTVKRSEGDGKRSDAKTPRRRQTDNNASGTESKKEEIIPKAHEILIDQIADAVMSGDGMVDSISPLLASITGHHESPVTDSLKDPLAALDQTAFISKDKLARTPDMPSPAITSLTRNSLLKHATRTLFDDTPGREPLPGRSAHLGRDMSPGTSTLPSTELPGYLFRPQSRQQDVNGDARLNGTPIGAQRTNPNVSLSNLMDLSNTSLFLQDSIHNESSEIVFNKTVPKDSDYLSHQQQADLLDTSPEMQLTGADNDSSRLSNPAHSPFTPASVKTGQKSELRTANTPSGLPLEDLEQTLLEITRTKTPQLPIRARQRVNRLRTLDEDPEDNSLTSERSFSPSVGTSSAKPAVTKETYSLQDKTDNKSNRMYRSWTGSNVLSSLREDNGFEIDNQQTKTRQISGGSQKSVTFSEHVDEHSFQSLGGISSGNLAHDEDDIQDEDLDIIDVHSMQDDMLDNLSSQSPKFTSNIITDSSNREMNSSPLGESYLRHSPQSKMTELSHSPLDSAVHSGLDLSPDFISNSSPQLKLVHISPMMTPSKTPKLSTRKRVLSQGRLASASSYADQSSGYSDTPPDNLSNHTHDSLVDGLSDLKLSSRMFRTGFGKENVQGLSQHHSPKASLQFEGLFDEDDSILIPGSPLS